MRVPFPSTDTIFEAYHDRLSRADSVILEAGRTWYNSANLFAHHLCDIRTDWSLSTACGVISALSPRERWESNKAKALAFATGQPIRGLGANLRRAQAVEARGLSALTGLKTAAFARAILGDPNAIVIDTWMLKPIGRKSVTNKQYKLCERALFAVAELHLMHPRDAQAAIWIVERGSPD